MFDKCDICGKKMKTLNGKYRSLTAKKSQIL